MRILAIGNFSAEYVRDSWVGPLKKLFETDVVDVVPLLVYGEGNFNYCQRYIEAMIRNNRYDYCYFYSDGLQLVFTDEFFAGMRASGLPVIVYHCDDEPEIWYQNNRRFDHRFDIIATHSKRGYEQRLADKQCPQAIYTPWGYNPDHFYKIAGLEKKYDVVFIGKYKAAGITSLHDEDGNLRQDILVNMAEFCKKNRLVFKVFGMGWQYHPILNEYYGGLLSHRQMVEVYNQTKIVFNPAFSSDGDWQGYQTKLRHYEVPGCGAFQITNFNPELLDHFKEDEEIIFYRDAADLEKKTLYYLEHETERLEIAEKGYSRVNQDHTTEKRIRQLFVKAAMLLPRKTVSISMASEMPAVQRIIIGPGRVDLPQTTDIVIKSWQELDKFVPSRLSAAYLHLIPLPNSEVSLVNTDYQGMRHLLNSKLDHDVISVRSLLRFPIQAENFVQINWHNFRGLIFSNDHDKNGFLTKMDYVFRDRVDVQFIEGQAMYLMNLLIKPQIFERFMKAYQNADPLIGQSFSWLHSYFLAVELASSQPQQVELFSGAHKKDRLFADLGKQHSRVVIYGARGYPIPNLLRRVEQFKVNLIGFIDRDLCGQTLEGYPIYNRSDLETLKPDAILISAENSGPEIYQSLSAWWCRCLVVPLFDNTDSIWQVMR
jgi:spore maturation protein CgeB